MGNLTAHCLVKNEENFIFYAVTSVINFVDKIIIFDTGSTDKTIDIISSLIKQYPNKIIFEEKGICDKATHTLLRQEMIEKTQTDWFMILDGDEVWTTRGMEEVFSVIKNKPMAECLIAPFYLLAGDVFHRHYKKGAIEMLGKKDFFYPRVFKMIKGIHWHGDYDQDMVYNQENKIFFNEHNTVILKNKFWHATHLTRSSVDDVFSSGGVRSKKVINTYFLVGRKIQEPLPEVFGDMRLSYIKSFLYFWLWIIKKIFYKLS